MVPSSVECISYPSLKTENAMFLDTPPNSLMDLNVGFKTKKNK
jgi:hypothetical protein